MKCHHMAEGPLCSPQSSVLSRFSKKLLQNEINQNVMFLSKYLSIYIRKKELQDMYEKQSMDAIIKLKVFQSNRARVVLNIYQLQQTFLYVESFFL